MAAEASTVSDAGTATEAGTGMSAGFLAKERDPDPRLDRVVTLEGFEAIARERMHPASYDYVAGGAGEERTLAENLAAWRRHRLRPRVLVDVSQVSTASTLLGGPAAMPVAIAPMATHALAHPDGETATARAAAVAGVPFTLSTMSSCSIEDVAAAAPNGTRWFQLYVQRDLGRARELVERAAAAGYRAIILTVDLPVVGIRERDRTSGFDLAVPLGNFPGGDPERDPEVSGYEALGGQRHVGLTWDDLETIRSWSGLPLIVKGILSAADARLAVDHGVDAVVVSNHGGRQLDRTPAGIDALPEVVEAVDGRAEVWVDGGVSRGVDIIVARALGATAVLVGRPIMWALATGGEAGVIRSLAILRGELEVDLALLGTPTVDAIRRDHLW